MIIFVVSVFSFKVVVVLVKLKSVINSFESIIDIVYEFVKSIEDNCVSVNFTVIE